MTVCPQSKRSLRDRNALRGAIVVGLTLQPWLAILGGCSSEERPNSADAGQAQGANAGLAGQSAGGVAGEGGRAPDVDANGGELSAGSGGHDPNGGDDSGPDAGGEAGRAAGGAPDGPFTGPDPFPCDSDAAAPPDFDAVCPPQQPWPAAVAAPVTVGPNASLLGITPDERTIVWLEPESSQVVYFIADRSSADAAFGQAQRLEGENVLALSPDGLRLVVLSDDQGALLERTRSDRGQPFGNRAEGDFVLLNADALTSGYGFSSCAFSPDGLGLFYTVGGADERHPLRESRRNSAGAAWPIGVALKACELEAHAGFGRYPTGVSSDGRTLFFYDAWRGVARGAWRETINEPFTWFRDLGNWRAVQVNAACDGLYYSAPEGAAPILVSLAP